MRRPIHVVGAGLAGSEAAWFLAQAGVTVYLHEMRPDKMTEAHHTGNFSELVCSNSFRSSDCNNSAIGLLHKELQLAGSLIMETAQKHAVPAGGALAVDRHSFSHSITEALLNHPHIVFKKHEIQELSFNHADEQIIVATGPLTSTSLAQNIQQISGQESLYFYDAIAPIVYTETIDMDICWFQSRYDKTGEYGSAKDYINCPLNQQQYEDFVKQLCAATQIPFKPFEKAQYFDGCLPIEVMASRGIETLRHGPMKPRGLTNAHEPEKKPYAVVQLRQDNKLGTLYNMVGFQTKMRYDEQKKIFRTIPGLEQAQFARLGGMHRNTYLNSPQILDAHLRLKAQPNLCFAGQITGCEGYVESAATGLLAAIFSLAEWKNISLTPPPLTTACGALLNHITTGHISPEAGATRSFQPMNINFGLFPPLASTEKTGNHTPQQKNKKQALSQRAQEEWQGWLAYVRQNLL